jgi:hypothetical protein
LDRDFSLYLIEIWSEDKGTFLLQSTPTPYEEKGFIFSLFCVSYFFFHLVVKPTGNFHLYAKVTIFFQYNFKMP